MQIKTDRNTLLNELKKAKDSGKLSEHRFFEEREEKDTTEFFVPGDKAAPSYIPTGPMGIAVHASLANYKFLRGPYASGKTVTCIFDIFAQALTILPDAYGVRHCRVVVMRETMPELRDNTMASWWESAPAGLDCTWRAASNTAIYEFEVGDVDAYPQFPNGTKVKLTVIFKAIQRVADIEKKLKGFEPTILWVNEASTVKYELIEAACGRLGRYPGYLPPEEKKHRAIFDTNSFDTKHQLFKYFYDKEYLREQMEKYESDLVVETFDYPSGFSENFENKRNLGPKFYRNLAIMKTPEWIKVNIENEFGNIVKGKPCYSSYVENVHVVDLLVEPGKPTFIACDGSKNACALVCQIMGNGMVNIIDEYHEEGKKSFVPLLDRMYRYLSNKYPPQHFRWVTGVVDPGESASARDNIPFLKHWDDAAKKYGVGKVVPARGTQGNKPRIRIEAANDWLSRNLEGRPAVLMDKKNTKWLQRACTNYVYKENEFGEVLADKVKKNDESHIAEAFGYLFFGPHSEIRHNIKPEATKFDDDNSKPRVVEYKQNDGLFLSSGKPLSSSKEYRSI